MPAHHLTAITPRQIANAVIAVLAGADLSRTAATFGLDPADLADAQDAYHTAGMAALERRPDHQWHHVRVQFPDWGRAETTAATQLGPRLVKLAAEHAIAGWWFLRKYPYWRLRLDEADTAAVAIALDELVTDGALTRWWPGIYEPEIAAFGGPVGMTIAHKLFHADSHSVLTYLKRDEPGIGRRELSLLLLNALQHAAGLDWFERGDTYDRIAQLRTTPAATDSKRITQLAASMRPLLAAPADAAVPLISADGLANLTQPWLAAFTTAGTQLREADTTGQLHRGLRAVLAHITIFHWNRLGLSATTQAILAHAARTAFLPGHNHLAARADQRPPATTDAANTAKA